MLAKFYALDIYGNETQIVPTQSQQVLMCNRTNIGFTSENGTSATINLALESGFDTGGSPADVYYSELNGAIDYTKSFKVSFDTIVSNRNKKNDTNYQNVRIIFSIGTLGGKNCALLLQDNSLICTSDAGWSASLGASGAKLDDTRAENNETQNIHFDFEFNKENRTFKIDISNSDGTNKTFTVNIADYMASTEDFVMNPHITFRTAKFEVSNFTFS